MSEAFAAQLLAAVRTPDITRQTFVRGIAAGHYPQTALRPYAQELAALNEGFPATLAALLARCPHGEARQIILQNLLEEEGAVSYGVEDGLVIAPQRRHAALAARFLQAIGAVTALTPPPGQWLSHELAQGRWLGPFAYLSIGIEANIPRTFRLLIEGFRRHYAFREEEIELFTEHLVADERHGAHGASVAAAAATTEAERREALAGAQRGAAAWWHFHQRHARRLRVATGATAEC